MRQVGDRVERVHTYRPCSVCTLHIDATWIRDSEHPTVICQRLTGIRWVVRLALHVCVGHRRLFYQFISLLIIMHCFVACYLHVIAKMQMILKIRHASLAHFKYLFYEFPKMRYIVCSDIGLSVLLLMYDADAYTTRLKKLCHKN